MSISIKHSLCVYTTVLAVISILPSCSNSSDSPVGKAISTDDVHKNAPVVSENEAKTIQKKIDEINTRSTEKRRLIIDGLKGEAEVTYNEDKELVKIHSFLKTESGTEVEEFFFENGVLTYSTHNAYTSNYSSKIKHFVLDQKFYYSEDGDIKGSYSRFGEVPEKGPHAITSDYQPFDVEKDMIKVQKLGRLNKIREALRV
ncbi:MAG: hypothetical protein ACPGED_07770 [Flavobacteriales bacterium]